MITVTSFSLEPSGTRLNRLVVAQSKLAAAVLVSCKVRIPVRASGACTIALRHNATTRTILSGARLRHDMTSRIASRVLPRKPFPALIALAGGSLFYIIAGQRYPHRINGERTSLASTVVPESQQDIATLGRVNRSRTIAEYDKQASSASSNEVDRQSPYIQDPDKSAWASVSSHFAAAREFLMSIHWPSLPDRMPDIGLPDWFMVLPGQMNKLQAELSMAPGSLADEIWQEAQDPDINPEIAYRASVRFGKSLCKDELEYMVRRKRHTTRALAKYLNIAEIDIDPDDVPTIAMCGSGGGLRALVAGASSYLSAQEAGLFDCVTYTAGVSGSCWLQTLYYSSICGQRHNKILDHLKKRLDVHIAYPPTALNLFTTAPTNKFLLSGCIEKLKADPRADFGLVDVYGLLLAGRLLVPRGELGVNPLDLKISNQRAYLTQGEHPLPIYTAVRHEIPIEASKEEVEKSDVSESLKQKVKEEAWFQWFEFTPYEFWCEELDAGIPTFAVGRKFSKGASVLSEQGYGQPETRIPLLMGIWGSAFCATLAHYYKGTKTSISLLNLS